MRKIIIIIINIIVTFNVNIIIKLKIVYFIKIIIYDFEFNLIFTLINAIKTFFNL